MEWLLGLCAVALGVFVLLPFETTSPPFTVLGRVLGEPLWGFTLLAHGVAQITCICTKNNALSALTALSGIGSWAFLAVFTFLVHPNAASWVVYAMFAFAWMVVLFRQPMAAYDKFFDAIGRTRWGHRILVWSHDPVELDKEFAAVEEF